MTERTVALLGAIPADAKGQLAEHLSDAVEFIQVPDISDRDRTKAALREAQVVVGDWPDYPVDETGVELIHQMGAGTENYDRDNLPEDATLCNVYGHGPAIAEHVFMVLTSLRRDLLGMDADLREGKWVEKTAGGDIRELGGSTLGIVGYGTIGQFLVEPARTFNMDVIGIRGTPPARTPREIRFLGGPDDLDTVLRESDAVVLSLPLNDQTRSLISEREFELMGEDALLINTARGPVVDEAALYHALEDRTIGGAAIDTWYNYPDDDERCEPANYPFDELDNVVMTPHMSGWSAETARYRWQFMAKNIARYYDGEDLENVVWTGN
jgi:phosphoglycerate dehydrogenase-like enzyme